MNRSNLSISRIPILIACSLLLALQSCVSHKELTTLNGNESVPDDLRGEKEVSNTILQEFKPYEIQPYDQLMIRINAFDGSTEDFLNREFAVDNGGGNLDYSPESVYFSSYTINDSGTIALPMLGTKKVSGLTVNQLKRELDEAYKPYLRFASAMVKLANQRVTILGEVNNPGVYYLYNEKTTLLERDQHGR